MDTSELKPTPNTAPKPAPIRVSSLNHSFGKGDLLKQILFDVSTEVSAGEIIIVTGPSGSGKTTMLTLVGALRSAQEGSVQVLGEELVNARPATLEKVRRQIGFIFQQHNLLGALTALENVELGIRASGRFPRSEHRKRSIDILNTVGLEERLHYKPEQLSGGQRQRVAIARALVSEPAMVLADEPTASLDKKSGRDVVDRMKTLAREYDTTILLVTHDNRILDIADRIIHLEDGRLSTFTDAVIANNRHMMLTLAENRNKQPIHDLVAELNETEFHDLLQEMSDESERFLTATEMVNNVAFNSILTQSLFAFTSRLCDILNADRVSLFEVDADELVLVVADDMEQLGEIRFPVGRGIAGTVAQSGEPIRIDDAYTDSRFNPEVDQQTGYQTKSILCLPLKNRHDKVFAVAQLLNRLDNRPFDAEDERQFTGFMASIGLILETQLQQAK